MRQDVVTLRDLGSTNGTFVGEVRVRDADLRVGAVVRCGSTTFAIEAVGEPSFLAVSDRESFGELVGGSFEMRRVYAVLERVAPSGSTVLVQGETGTGKDVVARSVHAASPAQRPARSSPVDCGAIPETLFESELFGHVRGAFTGALANRARRSSRRPNGGTLFLDEIGEMPLAMQAKLLRVARDAARFAASARRTSPTSTCASSARRTARSPRWSTRGRSARTSTTGSPSSR